MTDMPSRVWLRVCGGGISMPGSRIFQTVTGDSIEHDRRTMYVRADLVEHMAEAQRSYETRILSSLVDRSCTCHPDDNPPTPCPEKFAYSECVAASDTTTRVRNLENLLKRVLALGETSGWRRMPDQALFSSLPIVEDIKAMLAGVTDNAAPPRDTR